MVLQDGSCNGLQHYAALGRDRVSCLIEDPHLSKMQFLVDRELFKFLGYTVLLTININLTMYDLLRLHK